MADFLYVVQFSNGHIKVGRSNDPESRIAQHVERVACVGVQLAERHSVACTVNALAAEAALIQRCAEQAEGRNQREWFAGLVFTDVCGWANECAVTAPADDIVDVVAADGRVDFAGVIRTLKTFGVNQGEIAARCRCAQPSISDIATGKTKDPAYSIGAALLGMLADLKSELLAG